MASMITEYCITCGACEDECPTGAISLGDEIFTVDPARCTQCIGFHDSRKCAEVCPVDCCIPDPDRVEPEEVLLARAEMLAPDVAR